MLRLRSRVIQLSGCGADWLSVQSHHLTSRHVCPRVLTSSTQRRYASAENVEYKPIKKLLVANRGKMIGSLRVCCKECRPTLSVRNDCSSLRRTRLYIVCQSRDSNLYLFRHENLIYPSPLCMCGNLCLAGVRTFPQRAVVITTDNCSLLAYCLLALKWTYCALHVSLFWNDMWYIRVLVSMEGSLVISNKLANVSFVRWEQTLYLLGKARQVDWGRRAICPHYYVIIRADKLIRVTKR